MVLIYKPPNSSSAHYFTSGFHKIARIESEKKRLTADTKQSSVHGSMAKKELQQLVSGDMTDMGNSIKLL